MERARAGLQKIAVEFLRREQEPDGSWYGRWGCNYIYGTYLALWALRRIGADLTQPYVRKGAEWLRRYQNPDGGWGEDMRSYDDPGLAGRGESTASQTAWALLALLAAQRDDGAGLGRAHGTPGLGKTPRPAAPHARQESVAVERGVQWLIDHQREDGTWDEPQFTGTGFPRDFYLNYHLYRLVFPVMALGRYVAGTS